MSVTGLRRVVYTEAARRHFKDAVILLSGSRQANAGQLFGLAAECGLKAVVVACGVPTDSEGSVQKLPGIPGKGFRDHLPYLHNTATVSGGLVPDGRFSNRYMAMMPNLGAFLDWAVDQRYWSDSAVPASSLPGWQAAAQEVMQAVDQAKQDGLL